MLATACAILALCSICAFAANPQAGAEPLALGPKLSMSVSGNTATCRVTINMPGKYIDATLELWEGSNLIASWSDNDTGLLIISGNATVYSGHTYTLTVTGTVNGVAFTPSSITRTI